MTDNPMPKAGLANPRPAYLAQFLKVTSDAVFLADKALCVLEWNSQLEQLSGFLSSYAIGKNLTELFLPALAEDLYRALSATLISVDGKEVTPARLQLPGASFSCQVHVIRITDEEGAFLAIAGIVKPSNHPELNQQLHDHRLIQRITDAAPFIITVFDFQAKKYIFRNRQLAELLGYTPEEAAGLTDQDIMGLIHPEDWALVPAHQQKLGNLPDGEVAEFPFRAKNKSGNYRHLIARDTVFKRTPNGEIAEILGVSQEMHEMQRTKDLLASILDSSLSGISVLQAIRDEQGNITDFLYYLSNPAAHRLDGRMPRHGVDTLLFAWPHLKQEKNLFAKLVEVAGTGTNLHIQYHYHTGINRWLEITAARLPEGIVLIYTDVTERKEAEDEIRRSEALLVQAQQIANLGIWEWDILEDRITWSDALYKMFGLDPSVKKISFDTYLALLDEEARQKIKKLIEETMRTQEGYTFPHKVSSPNGQVKHLIGKGRLLVDENKKPLKLLGTVMEVTELMEMKQQLNEMLQVKSLGEAIPQIIWTATPTGHTDYVNRRWFEFTGLREEEMLSGKWVELIHPADAARTWFAWKRSLVSGKIYELEFRMRRQDGVYRWLLARAVPMTDETRKIVKWFGASTDIDDQKKAMEKMELIQDALSHYNKELSQKNQELHQINADLDNFIYTASHDLKAPINNIEGLLDLLKSEVATESELVERVFKLMENSIARFKNTLKDLTDISSTDRHLNETASLVHLPELLDEIEADIEKHIRESKAIIRFDFEVNDLIFSRKNIRSVLYNLLSNALKYRSQQRTPVVRVATRQRTGNMVELTVSDNGLGLDEKDAERVFEMFRRAHSHVEGSGIGLYIVKRIVENSGGKITVQSTLGKGTEFTVLLKQQAVL